MSWAHTVTGTPETIERLIADAVLPDYAEKTESHEKQLHIAKSTALHVLQKEGVTGKEIHVGMSGHNYTDTTRGDVFSVGVNITTVG